MEIQKFKELAEFDKGHPKWIEEIEEALSPIIMNKLNHIASELGVLSVLIFVRLNTFFKLSEVAETEKSTSEIKEAHI